MLQYRRVPYAFAKGKVLYRTPQWLFMLAGAATFFWALFDPRFRDGEGFLDAAFCLPFAVAIALMALGFAAVGPFKKFAFWFALALVGQAVALQMIDAGPLIRYQHYKTLGRLISEGQALLVVCFVAQTAAVIAGLRGQWSIITKWIKSNFKPWQILGVGLVFFLSSAAASREISAYVIELPFAAFIQLVSLANVVLMVMALPRASLTSIEQRFGRLVRLRAGQEDEPISLDRYALLAALWVTVVAALLSFFSYGRHPHVPDEVAYLLQARFMANGAIAMPAPLVPEGFDIYLMEFDGGRWFPSTPPGWPAILAVGELLGIPWLVNPLLAGANVLLAYLVIQGLYNRSNARAALFLLCISPWHIFMAMNFMTHTFTLTCALFATLAIILARKTSRSLWGWLGGFAVGMASLIRPLEGLIVAALLGLWALGLGGRRLKMNAIAGFFLGTVLVGAAVLPYNKMLTGDAARFPLNAYLDERYGPGRNDIGFGANRGMGWALQPFQGHTPLGALVNVDLNLFSLNIELLGWSTGSLLLIALICFSGTMSRADYLMCGVIAAVLGVYFFYWFSGGPDFGARYWYLVLIPCVVLTIRGAECLRQKLESEPASSSMVRGRIGVAVLAMGVLTLVNYFPWRAIDKYHHYLNMRPDISQLARDHSFGRSLVLIRGESHPDYSSAAIYNPLDLQDDAPVYAWDRSQQVRDQLIRAYPDRSVWIVNGPSVTGDGFTVVEGPLPATRFVEGDHKQ